MDENENIRVEIFIDGGNIYRSLKKIGIPPKKTKFDYSMFCSKLLSGRKFVYKKYYVGMVRNFDNSNKGHSLEQKQHKFLSGLRVENFKIVEGRLMYDEGRIREKGVDLKIAVDLVVDGIKDVYDVAILISSDTDLLPAIHYVQNELKKSVEYIGFSGRISVGLMKNVSASRIFSKVDLMELVKRE